MALLLPGGKVKVGGSTYNQSEYYKAKNTGKAAPAPLSTSGNQVKGVSYSSAPAPYALQQSPAPQTYSPSNYSPIPYATPAPLTGGKTSKNTAGGAPSQGVVVPTPAPATSSKSMMERALSGELGDKVKQLALAAQQRDRDTASSDITADSGDSAQKEKKIGDDIKYASTRAPLDLSYLTQAEDQAKKSLRAGESSVNSQYDSLKRGTQQEQLRETGSLSAGLARAGGYLGFTGSGEAVMVSLEKSHRAEILDLEAKRTQALAEARQAYSDQMYDVALEKQTLATEYEKQQYEEKQAYFEKVKTAQAEATKVAEQAVVDTQIYDALAGGAKSEFDVFGKLAGKATPEQIANFFAKVKPKTTESDAFKPTNSDTAKLIGAGFGSDDIQTMYDHLNEFGYDETLKASLTPYQRRVLDDMLTLKPEKAAAATTSSKPMSILDISRFTEMYGYQPPFGASFDEMEAFEAANVGKSPEEKQAALDELFGGSGTSSSKDKSGAPASPETVQSNLVTSLKASKNTYSREEAYDMAIEKLGESFDGDLPDSYKDAVDNAIREVYGDSFWQNIIPGGRGNFPLTAE